MMNRRQFASSIVGAAASLATTRSIPAQQSAAPAAPFKFSVMLWTLNKLGTLEHNLETVAQAGYTGVELVGEWHKWSDADYTRIAARIKALGLTVDSTAGVRVGFGDPAATAALIPEVQAAFEAAKRLDCRQVILVSGKRIEGMPQPTQHAGAVENLKRLAEVADKANGEIVIEPIDLLENASMYLTSVTEAFAMVREVASPRIKVLYDFYHEQKQAGNLIEKVEKNIDLISLFHIASVPGRIEPNTGEIRYENIYRKLAQLKYTGYIAMEYYPTGDPVASLKKSREDAIRFSQA